MELQQADVLALQPVVQIHRPVAAAIPMQAPAAL